MRTKTTKTPRTITTRPILVWHSAADDPPDDSLTVLAAFSAAAGEPLWLAWLDTETGIWRDVCGAQLDVPPTYWCSLNDITTP